MPAHRAAYAALQLPFLAPREKNSWLAEQRNKGRLSKQSSVTAIVLLEAAWCLALVYFTSSWFNNDDSQLHKITVKT
jgi:hypothetical protein